MTDQLVTHRVGGGPVEAVWLRRVGVICAGAVAFVGVAVLVCWYAGIEALTTLLPGYESMRPNTALSMIFLAVGVLLVYYKRAFSVALWVSRGLGIAASIIAAATLAQYLLSSSFGRFDVLTPGIDLTAEYARMAPATAVGILLLGVALVGAQFRRGGLMRALATAAFVLAYIVLLGYVLGAERLGSLGGQTGVAFLSAGCIAVLSASILLANPRAGLASLLLDSGSAGRLVRVMAPFFLLGPPVLGWARLRAQDAGLFETQFGAALLVMCMTVLGAALVWRAAVNLQELDRQRTAAALALAAATHGLEASYRMLSSNAGDVVLRSTEGVTEWVSPSVSRYGWHPSELIGHAATEFVHPDDVPTIVESSRAIQSGSGETRVRLRLRTANGEYCWVESQQRPDIGETGEADGVVAAIRDISDQVAAEAALKNSEEQFRLLAQNAADVVTRVDGNHQRVWVSDSVRDVLGWEPDEYLNLPESALLHPNDAERVAEARTKYATEDLAEMSINEVRGRHKTGRWVWLSSRSQRLPGGERIVALRDVSAEVEAREALRASERRYRLIADNAGDMVMRVADGEWQWVSPSVSAVLGWAPESVIGHPTSEVTHPDDQPAVARARAEVDAGRDVLVRKRLCTKHGDWVWVESHESPYFNELDDVEGVVMIARDITEQVQAEQAAEKALAELEYRSSHDLLTGMRNRDEVVRFLEHALRIQGSGQVAVLFIDVDRFKEVNDGISHAAGDAVLKGLAGRLAATIRPTDLVGRLGGDEFAAVLVGVHDRADATRTAERMRETVAAARFMIDGGHSIAVTISVGIAVSAPNSSAATLLSDADAALYLAKGDGRNRWAVADDSMRIEAARRLRLSDDLRTGLELDEFHSWFQPVADLRTGAIVGYEALARWVRGDMVVEAAEFIDVAEECGLLEELGSVVIREAITRLGQLDHGLVMAVNASPAQLAAPDFAGMVERCLDDAGADPSKLIVEITEHGFLNVGSAARQGIETLSELGVGFYVDGFGTGYSSLSTLRDYPVTGIKLDRSFTEQLLAEPDGITHRIASGLSDLAARLDLSRVAEGIETQAQAEVLERLGWETGQGLLFGEARPPAEYPVAWPRAADPRP